MISVERLRQCKLEEDELHVAMRNLGYPIPEEAVERLKGMPRALVKDIEIRAWQKVVRSSRRSSTA